MNGVHDMGGMHGFGAIVRESPEPIFHAAWERRVLGLTLAMGASGQWNIDMSRATRESLPAATYLSSGYYRIWMLALEKMLLERQLVTDAELAGGHAAQHGPALARVLRAEQVDAALARGTPTVRAARTPALFAVGQRVRALNAHPAGHTRLPRYVRGHAGTVTLVHGCHIFADRHAVAQADGSFDEALAWLYSVVFDGRELWGEHGDADTRISVDAWEPYLEAA